MTPEETAMLNDLQLTIHRLSRDGNHGEAAIATALSMLVLKLDQLVLTLQGDTDANHG